MARGVNSSKQAAVSVTQSKISAEERAIRALEAEGMSRSDAQSVYEAEQSKSSTVTSKNPYAFVSEIVKPAKEYPAGATAMDKNMIKFVEGRMDEVGSIARSTLHLSDSEFKSLIDKVQDYVNGNSAGIGRMKPFNEQVGAGVGGSSTAATFAKASANTLIDAVKEMRSNLDEVDGTTFKANRQGVIDTFNGYSRSYLNPRTGRALGKLEGDVDAYNGIRSGAGAVVQYLQRAIIKT